MDASKRKALATNIVCSVLSVLDVVCYILILIGLHKRFSFFTVVSYGRLLVYSLLVLLPAFVGMITVFLIGKVGKKTRATLYAFLGVSVAVCIVFIAAFSIMPPCASETDDPANYLVFDESCPASFITYNGMFPSQIPSEAENVRYFYRYYNYPDDYYDIFAQWRLPRAQYEAEKQRLLSLFPNTETESTGNYSAVFVSDEKKSTLDHIVFAFDDSSFTLRYCVSYIEHVDINGIAPYYEGLTW